jgi:hypothetical protein
MKHLNLLIQDLENNIKNFDQQNTIISKVNVGWHIEHSLLVIDGILKALQKSNPNNFKAKFSFLRSVVLLLKKIPRGKGQSPEVVVPKGAITLESLQQHILTTKANFASNSSLANNHYFTHPIFGDLNVKKTYRFLEIHTNHHLKIINDILTSK